MTKTVFCQKLKEELPALTRQPYPGELGKKIYETISQQAWQDWIRHQTMLINEYRLDLSNPESATFLEKEMDKFFFGEGSDKPEGYTAPESNN